MIDLTNLNLRNLIEIGGISLNLYGPIYIIGFIYLIFLSKQFMNGHKIDKDISYSLVLHIIIGSILGARIFHVLFYRPEIYIQYPLRIIQIWNGGLSIHGGLLGGFIAVYFFFRKSI